LLCATVANAQTVQVKLDFPPMRIDYVRPGLRLAALEPFDVELTMPTGHKHKAKGSRHHAVMGGEIPATFVRGFGLRHTVDACVAKAVFPNGSLVVNLPPELVLPSGRGVMTAQPIDCDAVLVLDGKTYTGVIHGPACPARRMDRRLFRASYLADACTYTGELKVK
jgi:hypothetical protein